MKIFATAKIKFFLLIILYTGYLNILHHIFWKFGAESDDAITRLDDVILFKNFLFGWFFCIFENFQA